MKKILLVVAVLCGCEVQTTPPVKPRMPPVVTQAPQAKQTEPTKLTKENYHRIQIGDQLADVESILGSNYNVTYEFQASDASTHILLWEEGRKSIRIQFRNYKVAKKSSMNL